MHASEKAVGYFKQGYNCAQATAVVFADDLSLDEETILKLMAGFGAGMGGLRETCGAVSAMVFAAGAFAGRYPPTDRAAKKALYDRVKKMIHAFVEKHGNTNCRELLRSASCTAAPDPSERTEEYYAKRPCARFVATSSLQRSAECREDHCPHRQRWATACEN
jgi:C_GCAxxG_C_C family probable redox protein